MKSFTLLIVAAAVVGAAVAAAGLGFNAVVLLAFGCTAGVVVLFVRDYSRFRRRLFKQEVRRAGMRLPHRLEVAPAPSRPGMHPAHPKTAPLPAAPITLH